MHILYWNFIFPLLASSTSDTTELKVVNLARNILTMIGWRTKSISFKRLINDYSFVSLITARVNYSTNFELLLTIKQRIRSSKLIDDNCGWKTPSGINTRHSEQYTFVTCCVREMWLRNKFVGGILHLRTWWFDLWRPIGKLQTRNKNQGHVIVIGGLNFSRTLNEMYE